MLVVVIFIFIIPLITMVFVNIPYISYFTEEEVQTMKYEMNYFTNSHKHPESGLFIEPDIDTNYRVFDSINWSTFNISLTNLTDPRSNPYVSEKPNFFFDYLFDKQNQDGSFSDVSGFSNIFSTYEVVQIINRLNHSFINADQNKKKLTKLSTILTIRWKKMVQDLKRINIPPKQILYLLLLLLNWHIIFQLILLFSTIPITFQALLIPCFSLAGIVYQIFHLPELPNQPIMVLKRSWR